MKKKIENDLFKLEQLSERLMTLCLQTLMLETNWLGFIDILLITQAKLNFGKEKRMKFEKFNLVLP